MTSSNPGTGSLAYLIASSTLGAANASIALAQTPLIGLNALGNVFAGMNGLTVLMRAANGSVESTGAKCNSAPSGGSVTIDPTAIRYHREEVFTYSTTVKMVLLQTGTTMKVELTHAQGTFLDRLEQRQRVAPMIADFTCAFKVRVSRVYGSDGRTHVLNLLATPVSNTSAPPWGAEISARLSAEQQEGDGTTGVMLRFEVNTKGPYCCCFFRTRAAQDNSTVTIWGDGTVTGEDGPCFQGSTTSLKSSPPPPPYRVQTPDDDTPDDTGAGLATFREGWRAELVVKYGTSASRLTSDEMMEWCYRLVCQEKMARDEYLTFPKQPDFVAQRIAYFEDWFKTNVMVSDVTLDQARRDVRENVRIAMTDEAIFKGLSKLSPDSTTTTTMYPPRTLKMYRGGRRSAKGVGSAYNQMADTPPTVTHSDDDSNSRSDDSDDYYFRDGEVTDEDKAAFVRDGKQKKDGN